MLDSDTGAWGTSMRVACVTTFDVRNMNAFGGRIYYMIRTFGEQFSSFEDIGPLGVRGKHALLSRAKRRFYKRLRGSKYTPERDRILLKHYARQVALKLPGVEADIVFSPMSPGSQPIAYLECDQPIVVWTDATFAGAKDLYAELSATVLCNETIRDGLANERAALNRCRLIAYSSDWAARTAIQHYDLDPSKIKVVPFGANLDCSRGVHDIEEMVESRPPNRCKLLFLGAAWSRKGGDTALQVAEELNRRGLRTELMVVGCHPTVDEPLPRFVRSLGYVRRSTRVGAYALDKLLAESHFLILPTTADCTPLVIPEANSFGVPCITSNVGGLPTIVRDGVNGKTFSVDAKAEEYSAYIADLFSSYARYKDLAASSFNEYQARLNWSVGVRTMEKMMMELTPGESL